MGGTENDRWPVARRGFVRPGVGVVGAAAVVLYAAAYRSYAHVLARVAAHVPAHRRRERLRARPTLR